MSQKLEVGIWYLVTGIFFCKMRTRILAPSIGKAQGRGSLGSGASVYLLLSLSPDLTFTLVRPLPDGDRQNMVIIRMLCISGLVTGLPQNKSITWSLVRI